MTKKRHRVKINKTVSLTKKLLRYYEGLLFICDEYEVLAEGKKNLSERLDSLVYLECVRLRQAVAAKSMLWRSNRDPAQIRFAREVSENLAQLGYAPAPVRTHELRKSKLHTLRGENPISVVETGTRIVHIEKSENKKEVFPNGKEERS